MGTPGAIGVYTSGAGVPNDVSSRPWRGVYHHFDGQPSGLGAHLIDRVHAAKGDMATVVRVLIDDAPWGWESCFGAPMSVATERNLLSSLGSFFRKKPPAAVPSKAYSKDDPGLSVSSDSTDAVAYAYVFDLEARRLDAFATHANGERIGSVGFSLTGEPDLPAFDLLPEERAKEASLPGARLSADALMSMLRGLTSIETPSAVVQWVSTGEDPDGSLSIVFQELTFQGGIPFKGGILSNIVEREWRLIPAAARSEPDRVRHLLEALVDVVTEEPTRSDAFWIASLDPLRRSKIRQRETFRTMLRAHAKRYFSDASGC